MGSVSTIYNGVRQKIAGRALMDVAFSSTSTNGVQNKVIKAKFDEVEDFSSPKDVSSAINSTHKRDMVLTKTGNVVQFSGGYFDIGTPTSHSYPYTVATLSDELKPFKNTPLIVPVSNGSSIVSHVQLTINTDGTVQINSQPSNNFVIMYGAMYIKR